jgi:ABC-type multidrug transport system fused ATPase/permease subunit
MNYIACYKKVLPRKLKIHSIFICLMILISMLLEVASIGLIIPTMILFLENNISIDYPWIEKFVILFFYEPKKFDYALFGLTCLLSGYLIKNSFLAFFAYAEANFINKVRKFTAVSLFKFYIGQDIKYHVAHHSSKLINNVTKENQLFINSIIHYIILINESVIFIGITIFLLLYQTKLFLILFMIFSSVVLIYSFFTSNKIVKFGHSRQENDKLTIKQLQESLQGIREIKIYNSEKFLVNIFKNISENIYNLTRKSDLLQKLPKLILEFSAVLAISVIILISLKDNLDESQVTTILGVLALATIRLLPSITKIFYAYQRLKFVYPSVELISKEFEEMHNFKLKIRKNISVSKSDFNTNILLNNSIKVEKISFKYEQKSKKELLFKNLSCEIKKGEITGLVGASGSGKSTLIDLIMGLQTPLSGKILVDNKDINKELSSWQKNISYVPQSIFLIDDTIRGNIAFGEESGQIDNPKLESSILNSELKSFLADLPDGLDTLIGESGSKLSGGQKKRIILARALYKNPNLLVLDETTSSIDSESEEKIMETLQRIKNKIAIIIISHQDNLSQYFDTIYKLSNDNINKIK